MLIRERLSLEWQAYISRTHKLRKAFIYVKGIYYQEISNAAVKYEEEQLGSKLEGAARCFNTAVDISKCVISVQHSVNLSIKAKNQRSGSAEVSCSFSGILQLHVQSYCCFTIYSGHWTAKAVIFFLHVY